MADLVFSLSTVGCKQPKSLAASCAVALIRTALSDHIQWKVPLRFCRAAAEIHLPWRRSLEDSASVRSATPPTMVSPWPAFWQSSAYAQNLAAAAGGSLVLAPSKLAIACAGAASEVSSLCADPAGAKFSLQAAAFAAIDKRLLHVSLADVVAGRWS